MLRCTAGRRVQKSAKRAGSGAKTIGAPAPPLTRADHRRTGTSRKGGINNKR